MTDMISAHEFAEILERNGFPGAASDVANGKPWAESTAYLADIGFIAADDDGSGIGFYDDGEGRWLRDFIRGQQPVSFRDRILRLLARLGTTTKVW